MNKFYLDTAKTLVQAAPYIFFDDSIGSVGFALPYTQVCARRLNADGSLGEDFLH
jgi:hypothetical protein